MCLVCNQLLGSQMKIVADQKQQNVVGKPWSSVLKATRPGYFSQWCDTLPHSPSCLSVFSSLLNSLSRIYLWNPSIPNPRRTWYCLLHYCCFTQLVVFVETLTCIRTQVYKPLLQIENLPHISQPLNNYNVPYTSLGFNIM